MRKELQVCKELQRWFKTYGIECWLNEGAKKFVIKGSRKKPDLIIWSQNIQQYIVIEVKKGDCAKDIYDSSKILEYYKEYNLKTTKYFINNEEIQISSFAIATLQSMFGKLFGDEEIAVSIEKYKNDVWKKINKERKLEPLWEYPRTHDFLRHLWAEWRKHRERKPMPGVGIILSDILNKEKITITIDKPILFDMQWERLKKPQWKVRQKWL